MPLRTVVSNILRRVSHKLLSPSSIVLPSSARPSISQARKKSWPSIYKSRSYPGLSLWREAVSSSDLWGEIRVGHTAWEYEVVVVWLKEGASWLCQETIRMFPFRRLQIALRATGRYTYCVSRALYCVATSVSFVGRLCDPAAEMDGLLREFLHLIYSWNTFI